MPIENEKEGVFWPSVSLSDTDLVFEWAVRPKRSKMGSIILSTRSSLLGT